MSDSRNTLNLQDIRARAIFMERILEKLRARFPRDKIRTEGTLRDLCDAAYDVAHEEGVT